MAANGRKKHYGIKDFEKEFGKLTFGQALRTYRLGQELTLKEFSKKLKISSSVLSYIENEKKIPSFSECQKIAQTLKEPVDFWLALAINDQLFRSGIDLMAFLYKKK